MKNKYNVISVVRTFNNPNIMQAVENMLTIATTNHIVAVTINTDTGNKGETNGDFTKNLLAPVLVRESEKPRLIIHTVNNWGKNSGSAAALNDAVSEIFYRLGRLPSKRDIVFNLSVESEINAGHPQAALDLFLKHKDLAVVGIKGEIIIGQDQESLSFAQSLKTKLQYRLPQNTAAFWRADLLRLAGGFRTECDFSGLTIEIDGEAVPVAGMEDFPTLLHLAKLGYKWGLVENEPMICDLSDVRQDEARWKQNLIKIKRQEAVIEVWIKKFFRLTLKEGLEILEKARVY